MYSQFLSRCLPALLALALAAGCDRNGGPLLTAETSDSNYTQGLEQLRQGHDKEALDAFLRVIATRGENAAPESHLQAGQLFAQKLKDPVEAIHHYRKFCELVPASPQVGLVRQQIDAALREFALSALPGQPQENQSASLLATVERLQAENKQLRDAMPASRAGARPPPAGLAVPISPAPPLPDTPIRAAPAPPSQASVQAATTSAHTHRVVAGDTLSSIAQRYYGDKSRWPEIQVANRNLLPTPKTPLKIGMELKIP